MNLQGGTRNILAYSLFLEVTQWVLAEIAEQANMKTDEKGDLVLLLFYLRGQEYMRLPTHVR
jgi:hypothetical protein